MIDMPQIQSIRRMHSEGHSVSAIATTMKVSRPTVRKYLKMDDFSQPLPQKSEGPSKLDPYKELIEGWLEEDKKVWRKQRHTAQRIFNRLKEESDYPGSYALVQRFVKKARGQGGKMGYLDLIWAPGTIQVDFGQADFYLDGELVRMHYLVVTFPYSNVGLAQIFNGENAECVCKGLRRIFEYVGGVPRRAVFDNAAGVGKRVCDTIRLGELFSRFQLHYGVEVTFCNPYSGHEKGNVENKVGTTRRNLFVPVPDISDVRSYNEVLLATCIKYSDLVHYRKGERVMSLYEEDCFALAPLPEKPFECIRYETYKTDKYGNITVGGHHRYSTSSSLPCENVTVAFSADKIEIYDLNGTLVATHGRLYGEKPDESVDPGASLRLLARRPGAWKNSVVRMSLPETLKNYIDAQDKDVIKTCLDTLITISDETDYETAIKAAWEVHRDTGRLKRSDISIYAQRLWDPDIVYDEAVDLHEYDQVFSAVGVSGR